MQLGSDDASGSDASGDIPERDQWYTHLVDWHNLSPDGAGRIPAPPRPSSRLWQRLTDSERDEYLGSLVIYWKRTEMYPEWVHEMYDNALHYAAAHRLGKDDPAKPRHYR